MSQSIGEYNQPAAATNSTMCMEDLHVQMWCAFLGNASNTTIDLEEICSWNFHNSHSWEGQK